MRYSTVIDAEAERYGSSDPEIHFSLYPVLSTTPCGAWIEVEGEDFQMRRRFVNLKRPNKFAYLTPREALSGFYKRKCRQAKILQAQAAYVADLRDALKREVLDDDHD